MKFCTHCGKELLDEAVICPGCGCAVNPETPAQASAPAAAEENTAPVETAEAVAVGETEADSSNKVTNLIKKWMGNKSIVTGIIVAVVAVALIISGVLLWNHIRTEQVKEQLAGKTFSFTDYDVTYSLGRLKFDDEAQCTEYHYWALLDQEMEYEWSSYKVKFKDGMVFLVCHNDEYEVQYDRYGRIDGLYDIDMNELYD